MFRAMHRGILLVIVPGGLFVFGLIAWLKPALPSPAAVYGCYGADVGPLIRVRADTVELLDGRGRSSPARITPINKHYLIELDHGYLIRKNASGGMQIMDSDGTARSIAVEIGNSERATLSMRSDEGPIRLWPQDCPR